MKIKIQAYKPLLGFRGVFDASWRTSRVLSKFSSRNKACSEVNKNVRHYKTAEVESRIEK